MFVGRNIQYNASKNGGNIWGLNTYFRALQGMQDNWGLNLCLLAFVPRFAGESEEFISPPAGASAVRSGDVLIEVEGIMKYCPQGNMESRRMECMARNEATCDEIRMYTIKMMVERLGVNSPT